MKQIYKNCVIAFSLPLLLFSCTFTTSNIEKVSGKNVASNIVDSFYHYKKVGDTIRLLKLFTNKREKIQGMDRDFVICSIIKEVENKFGEEVSKTLLTNQTKVIKGFNTLREEYIVDYKVVRNLKTTNDHFKLILEDNQVKISDYFVKEIN